MSKTDFADKTANDYDGTIDFFGSVHIELVAQLCQTSSDAMSKRFQKTGISKILTAFSIVTVISVRDHPELCQELDVENFRGCCL
ncbi:hypothetical protein Y032_0024g928 [Ancylostoma ceylanicum]|uniref:Uncharacterized protein n=1 Tax=Ancylostoma ceylanicum TaxID=53326 RepID=A0A016UVX6_9BILA|nr:hypothetical protein Y032_0024g928 [Ancylostoma ceylanicum]